MEGKRCICVTKHYPGCPVHGTRHQEPLETAIDRIAKATANLPTMNPLACGMVGVIESIHVAIALDANNEGGKHRAICMAVANKHGLWINDRFPVWLSRVVEGCIADYNEGTGVQI